MDIWEQDAIESTLFKNKNRDLSNFKEELEDSEKIKYVLKVSIIKNLSFLSNKNNSNYNSGTLVLTNQRGIFKGNGRFKKETIVIEGDSIFSVDWKIGFFSTEIQVICHSACYTIKGIKKDTLRKIVSVFNDIKKHNKISFGNPALTNANKPNELEEIKIAKELLNAGIINEEDFEKIKSKNL